MEAIDLRSDTLSHPTPAMREAMATAVVGDDVYGEDPTVNQLEAETAALLGKEAALFVTSGTQGNLVAVMTHCARGEEMIVGKQAHMFKYEAGSSAALASVHPYSLEVQTDGTLRLDEIESAVRGDNVHYPRTRLIALENTQGTVGGIPISAAYTAQVGAIARKYNLKLHIDGARIFNAAAYYAENDGGDVFDHVRALTQDADSVSFCLSKGLCAPVGSLLVGSRQFIHEARRARKLLGGGLRQVGILAAAGLIGLREMTRRLHEDHANARHLAHGLAQIPHITIDPSRVLTNMVFFELAPDAPLDGDTLQTRLRQEYNVWIQCPPYSRQFRAVTHYWITRERVECTLEAMRTLLTA
jgi:threonine aldolase